MKNQESLIGTILTLKSPEISEIVSMSGFDWVMIDMEHSTLSLGDVQNMIQVINGRLKTIVRVPSNSEVWIKQVLDTGCDGIMVPMVLNKKDALRAINSATYPPKGSRSVGIGRAHRYGSGFNDYLFNTSKNLTVIIQVEHIEGVNNIDDLLKVDGVGGIFIGPYDLSASLGLTGEVGHEKVQSAIKLVKERCRDADMPYGIFGMTPESVKNEIEEGCTFLLCGIDSVLFAQTVAGVVKKLKSPAIS